MKRKLLWLPLALVLGSLLTLLSCNTPVDPPDTDPIEEPITEVPDTTKPTVPETPDTTTPETPETPATPEAPNPDATYAATGLQTLWAGSGSIFVKWTAPSISGKVLKYRASSSTTTDGPWTALADSDKTSQLFTGLTNDSNYYFRVETLLDSTVMANAQVSAQTLEIYTLSPQSTTLTRFYQGSNAVWFKISLDTGNKVDLQWEDSYQKSSAATDLSVDIALSAYKADKVTSYFLDYDSGYTSPKYITAQNSTIYLKTRPFTSGLTGVFGLRYNKLYGNISVEVQ